MVLSVAQSVGIQRKVRIVEEGRQSVNESEKFIEISFNSLFDFVLNKNLIELDLCIGLGLGLGLCLIPNYRL